MEADNTVVFVLGAPGSGKGTQCARIKEEYGFLHMSTGDLLRAEVEEGTEIGQRVEGLMQAGEMVPTDLVLDLLVTAMDDSGMTRFLVDGYPRTLEQLKAFEEKIQPADHVLVLTVPEDVAMQRLLQRGAESGRADDNEETIRNRLQVFQEESVPVIEHLKATGRVQEIEASADEDTVFAAVEPVMDMLQERASAKEEAVATAESGGDPLVVTQTQNGLGEIQPPVAEGGEEGGGQEDGTGVEEQQPEQREQGHEEEEQQQQQQRQQQEAEEANRDEQQDDGGDEEHGGMGDNGEGVAQAAEQQEGEHGLGDGGGEPTEEGGASGLAKVKANRRRQELLKEPGLYRGASGEAQEVHVGEGEAGGEAEGGAHEEAQAHGNGAQADGNEAQPDANEAQPDGKQEEGGEAEGGGAGAAGEGPAGVDAEGGAYGEAQADDKHGEGGEAEGVAKGEAQADGIGTQAADEQEGGGNKQEEGGETEGGAAGAAGDGPAGMDAEGGPNGEAQADGAEGGGETGGVAAEEAGVDAEGGAADGVPTGEEADGGAAKTVGEAHPDREQAEGEARGAAITEGQMGEASAEGEGAAKEAGGEVPAGTEGAGNEEDDRGAAEGNGEAGSAGAEGDSGPQEGAEPEDGAIGGESGEAQEADAAGEPHAEGEKEGGEHPEGAPIAGGKEEQHEDDAADPGQAGDAAAAEPADQAEEQQKEVQEGEESNMPGGGEQDPEGQAGELGKAEELQREQVQEPEQDAGASGEGHQGVAEEQQEEVAGADGPAVEQQQQEVQQAELDVAAEAGEGGGEAQQQQLHQEEREREEGGEVMGEAKQAEEQQQEAQAAEAGEGGGEALQLPQEVKEGEEESEVMGEAKQEGQQPELDAGAEAGEGGSGEERGKVMGESKHAGEEKEEVEEDEGEGIDDDEARQQQQQEKWGAQGKQCPALVPCYMLASQEAQGQQAQGGGSPPFPVPSTKPVTPQIHLDLEAGDDGSLHAQLSPINKQQQQSGQVFETTAQPDSGPDHAPQEQEQQLLGNSSPPFPVPLTKPVTPQIHLDLQAGEDGGLHAQLSPINKQQRSGQASAQPNTGPDHALQEQEQPLSSRSPPFLVPSTKPVTPQIHLDLQGGEDGGVHAQLSPINKQQQQQQQRPSNSRPTSAQDGTSGQTAQHTITPTPPAVPAPELPRPPSGRLSVSPPALNRGSLAASRATAAEAKVKAAQGENPLAHLPVRQYMDAAVVPTLREGLRALNKERPPDPLLFLSDFLLKARAGVKPGDVGSG